MTTPSNHPRIPGLGVGYAEASFLNTIAGLAGRSLREGRLKLNPAIEWTDGGLATTPSDLAHFYHALLNGELLEPEQLREMIESAVDLVPDGSQKYGFGLVLAQSQEFGSLAHHSGWFPGYVTNVTHYRDYNFTVALQINHDGEAETFERVREIARVVRAALPGAPREGSGTGS